MGRLLDSGSSRCSFCVHPHCLGLFGPVMSIRLRIDPQNSFMRTSGHELIHRIRRYADAASSYHRSCNLDQARSRHTTLLQTKEKRTRTQKRKKPTKPNTTVIDKHVNQPATPSFLYPQDTQQTQQPQQHRSLQTTMTTVNETNTDPPVGSGEDTTGCSHDHAIVCRCGHQRQHQHANRSEHRWMIQTLSTVKFRYISKEELSHRCRLY